MRKNQWKTFAGLLSFSLLLGLGAAFPANVKAATEHWNDASSASARWNTWKEGWAAYSSNYENVSLTPGINETQLNFAWYCHSEETPKVRISINEDMSGAVEYAGVQTAISADVNSGKLVGYYSNKVTAEDLKENTQYYYQVYQNGAWQEVEKYRTKSFSEFSFLYVGDPQIGACTGQTSTEDDKMGDGAGTSYLAARNDAYNWNLTLNNALAGHANVSFMVSAGDQVNYSTYEEEYAGYLGADALKSLPVATTIGNHDSTSYQYSLHFNNPNAFDLNDTIYTQGKTKAGTDYYYTYGEVLFIVLDTNNYNCATHKNVIQKAVEENPEVKWRVVMFHQDIYGSGYDHSDSDGMILRTQLTPIMDEFGIDVVLQGHDHTYSRTYQLTSDGAEHTAFDATNTNGYGDDFQNENNCYAVASDVIGGTITNPEGTVYLEANSATGSKFYNLIASQQDYIAERSQTWTPSYSVIDVTKDSFKVTTYDASTGKVLNGSSSYTIIKTDDTKEEDSDKTDGTQNGGNHVGTTTPDATNNSNVNNNANNSTANNNANSNTTNKTGAPKKVTISQVTSPKTKTVKVTWKKVAKASGYRIVYTYKKGFKKNVKTKFAKKGSKISVNLTKLKKGKKLYIKVCAYKTVNGEKVYGSYSKVKKVKVK